MLGSGGGPAADRSPKLQVGFLCPAGLQVTGPADVGDVRWWGWGEKEVTVALPIMGELIIESKLPNQGVEW